jgi:hypothetical protein
MKMSYHCLFCGGPDNWVRGKERVKTSGFVTLVIKDFLGQKILRYEYPFDGQKSITKATWVCHADCLKRVLKAGQAKYLEDGWIEEFEFLDKEARMEHEDEL